MPGKLGWLITHSPSSFIYTFFPHTFPWPLSPSQIMGNCDFIVYLHRKTGYFTKGIKNSILNSSRKLPTFLSHLSLIVANIKTFRKALKLIINIWHLVLWMHRRFYSMQKHSIKKCPDPTSQEVAGLHDLPLQSADNAVERHSQPLWQRLPRF